MLADADLAAVGRALGDTHRARFVLALLGGQELSAGDLAARAGTSSSLTSAHLAKLLESGLVSATRRGRQRHYRLAGQEIAQAIEALLVISPQRSASGLSSVTKGKALQRGRTCYDHLAGRLGVALADAFEQEHIITAADGGWALTSQGERRLSTLSLDPGALHRGRRPVLLSCPDWTERRPHMAGLLGQVLASKLLELTWVRHIPGTRAVAITPLGEQQLLTEFAVQV